MKDTDGVLAMLQDIKEILYGIALLMLGGILCVTGVLLDGWGLLLLCAGIFLCGGGAISVHQGYQHHEVVEKQD